MRYDPRRDDVPEILVRALDEGAQRSIKAAACEAGIPLVENVDWPALCTRTGSLGPIPPALYLPVAQIVAALARDPKG